MEVPEVKRLKSLEEENARLKKLLAEAVVNTVAFQIWLSGGCGQYCVKYPVPWRWPGYSFPLVGLISIRISKVIISSPVFRGAD
jgi:putative transposase